MSLALANISVIHALTAYAFDRDCLGEAMLERSQEKEVTSAAIHFEDAPQTARPHASVALIVGDIPPFVIITVACFVLILLNKKLPGCAV